MKPATLSRRQQKIRERERKKVEEIKKQAKTYVNQAPFRYYERNFKSKVSKPDFSNVIDFDHFEANTKENNDAIVPVTLTHDLNHTVFGDQKEPCRNAYVLKTIPGLIVIPNAFTPQAQRKLIKQCLDIYPRPPNTSNLDTHYVMPKTGLWPLYQGQKNGTLKESDPAYYVPKKINVDMDSTTYSDSEEEEEQQEEKKRKIETPAAPTACSPDFQPIIDTAKPDPLPAPGVPLLSPSNLVRKLRWITLGYQYHWPTKTYHLDRQYPFPSDVADLTKAVVTAVESIGYKDWVNKYKGEDFHAEAGVINYYQYRDTLMGHVDRSELNMEAPLVSLSLGHSCIYLIGGETRETVPTALYLRSGDIIVMTEPCRKAFHGVPLILEDTLPDYLSNKNEYPDAPDWKLFGDYMMTSRINLNIRQVYPKGQSYKAA